MAGFLTDQGYERLLDKARVMREGTASKQHVAPKYMTDWRTRTAADLSDAARAHGQPRAAYAQPGAALAHPDTEGHPYGARGK